MLCGSKYPQPCVGASKRKYPRQSGGSRPGLGHQQISMGLSGLMLGYGWVDGKMDERMGGLLGGRMTG